MLRKSFIKLLIRLFTIISFATVLNVGLLAQVDSTIQKNDKTSLNELKKDINALINNPDFSNAAIGISVQSVETGEYFYRLNEAKNFIPASGLKLITTSAALHYLGEDYQYQTSLYLDGELFENGEFVGNVIIKGTGDPTISSYFMDDPVDILDNWGQLLDSLGIRSIRGNIIGDDLAFDDIYYGPGWSWDDMTFPYSAQVSALSINDNRVDIVIKAGRRSGQRADFDVLPENSYVRVINNVETVGYSGITEIFPNREQRTNIIELFGTINLDSTRQNSSVVSVAIDNPTLYFLNLFKKTIEEHKIRFRGALLDISDWNEPLDYYKMKLISTYNSIPLKDIIKVVNKQSHNLAADILLKTIGREKTDEGSFGKGITMVQKYLARIGIPPDNIYLVDGSGLSRLNLISPKYITTLLSNTYRNEHRDIFINSLAMPGEEGTLKRRMKNSRAEEAVMAKTGSMNGISTISGFVITRDKEMLAFSIMIMNYTVPLSLAHNMQDLILMRLASFSR